MNNKRQRQNTKGIPPAPYGAIPSERQLRWHGLEFYGFLHFTVNTFTDKEWGFGDESPKVFAPTEFDADQIVSTAAAGGMVGLVLTCKHHDGFCLWPSRFTEHSVKNSPWRGGRGDVVREISEACRRHDLKFGVYLSPWDRNHAAYSRPEYIQYYRNQLRELLTDYGPLFEVWFDGANGGDGFYGGAREKRGIDRHTYYDWDNTWQIVRELQPDACMFSDAGPDIRWVGNESGVAGDPCWHTIDPVRIVPGEADIQELNRGHRHGKRWIPAECDVSIRPGWFYHQTEDDRVRTPENLMDLYFQSVGRGASLHLNLPPDRRGRIHERDAAALRGFRERLTRIFSQDLARSARVTADNVRGRNPAFSPSHTIDGKKDTYWATDDATTRAELVLDFDTPVTFNVIDLREFLPLGQRIDDFIVSLDRAGQWQKYANGAAIGNRRLVCGAACTTRRVRIEVQGSVSPALSEVGLFHDPEAPTPQ
jgi:alpha-L-fucosidase